MNRNSEMSDFRAILTESDHRSNQQADFALNSKKVKRKTSNIFPSFLRRRTESGNYAKDTTVPDISDLWPYAGNDPTPCVENYKNITHKIRPTVEDLHKPLTCQLTSVEIQNGNMDHKPSEEGYKFGWINGVYIRTLLSLWGVMLFLRMGWMVGEAGIIFSLAQVLLSTVVTALTACSMTALCANGDIGAGGVYGMVSRTLGPEAGAVVGITFGFKNSVMVSLNLVGAAETICSILNMHGVSILGTPSGANDIRIVATILLVVIAIIPFISMEVEARTMLLFFLTIVAALINYAIGSVLPPDDEQQQYGFVGLSAEVFVSNLAPHWHHANFFTVFGVFFPSMTGIFTGASMSGDLKRPAKDIPKGTFLAILTTSVSYVTIVLLLGATFLPFSNGSLDDVINRNVTCSETCAFGLIPDYWAMLKATVISRTGLSADPLMYAGIFSATLSTALACYTSAPRIFQAFAKDNLIPGMQWFGKGFGPTNDPRRGYLLTFTIAFLVILIADLNLIAPLISNFYLATYCLVNFTCFHVALLQKPSFRPSFRYFNKWLSLICALICVAIMFQLDWISAIFCILIMLIIWLYMIYHKPDCNWGPSTEAQTYATAISSVYKLNRFYYHVKNYRPMVLALTGDPKTRPALVDLANAFAKDSGLLFLGHIVDEQITYQFRVKEVNNQNLWLQEKKLKAFYVLYESNTMEYGVKAMTQTVGISQLKPNIIMMGYKNDWNTCEHSSLLDYFNTIHQILEHNRSLIILRVGGGLDCTKHIQHTASLKNTKEHCGTKQEESNNNNNHNHNNNNTDCDQQWFEHFNRFSLKQPAGVIDIWWLYDTGGLSVLVPYLLSQNKRWSKSKLRLFSVATDNVDPTTAEANLTKLLRKFRIPLSDVTVFSDKHVPSEETKQQFRELIQEWMSPVEKGSELTITKNDLEGLKEKTRRNLYIRDLLVKNSKQSNLVVMTVPIPRKGACPAPLYLAWLEILTKDMPPVLLIRGNQQSVLTFYC